jgi:spore germination cell wall hydrolase CwlJ-like protein
LYKNHSSSSTEEGVVMSDEIKDWHKTTMTTWCDKHVPCLKMAEALYFEARGEGVKGMTAVAHVIKNRMKKHSMGVYAVVMKEKQFSYTARKDLTIRDAVKYSEAKVISALVLTGNSKDITNGSTHYVAPKRLTKMPRWTKVLEQTLAINNHVFYRG